jgi:carboxyl-terminal processing protease
MASLVLDLRDNGGGSVRQAADVAGEFLPEGALVYTAEGRKKEMTDTGRVRRSFWRQSKNYPIVVLINRGTASAAELVAGALQDHDRALIVGRPSFGKSLLMRGFPLADGSVMMLVVGHVRTPCGRTIQRAYKDVSSRDYFRLAGASQDTARRPACSTKSGRRVFGGGGIYPDVVADEQQDRVPLWMSIVAERELILGWTGAFLEERGGLLVSAEAFVADSTLRTVALSSFRTHATRAGVAIPNDLDADRQLWWMLSRFVAFAKWGSEAAYLVEARLDPVIRRASSLVPLAAQLVRPPD